MHLTPTWKSNPKKFLPFIKNKWNDHIGVSPLGESTSLKFTKQIEP